VTSSRGGDDTGERDVESVEVDSFLRAVAKTPREDPGEHDLAGRALLHFHVVERLGAGGMGVVYRAIDEKLRRPVALKVLSPRLVADARHRDTLLREARSAAALSHSNIAAIHEVHDGPDGTFFVMELVEGETLRARLNRTGPLPVVEALRVASQIARGLARAHASNVVHRALKCENVMLTREGDVKLLDFGLATIDDASPPPTEPANAAAAALAPTMPATATPTTGGAVAGTPASMAPEQARGEPLDARADVYAFGVVLYEMLTARPPFAHRKGRPWDWGGIESTAWVPGKPLRATRSIERLVHRCLSYAREQRPADGAALVSEIARCAPTSRGRLWAVAVAVALPALGVAIVTLRHGRDLPLPPAPSAASSPAPARPATMRRVIYDDGLGVGSLSADETRVAYITFPPQDKAVRVRGIATQRDEWFETPDGRVVTMAMLRGEGPGERLYVGTASGTIWSIRLDTKKTTRIADSDWIAPLRTSLDGRYVVWLQGTEDDPRGYVMLDTTTGVRTPLGVGGEVFGVAPSPDGSVLAWLDGSGTVPRLLLARSSDPSKRKELVFDSHLLLHLVDWVDPDRLVVASRQIDPPGGMLWTVRIDPTTLEVKGPPAPVTSWSGFAVWDFKVHRAEHAVSLWGQTSDADMVVGGVHPGTHAIETLHVLAGGESSDVPTAWAADDRTVVFDSDRSGRWGVYAQDVVSSSAPVPLAVSPVRADWPELALRGTELLYWRVPDEGAPSLMRTPFDGARAHEASALFSAPDLGNPLGSHEKLRCPARSDDCILRWATTSEAAGWYRLDPRDGTRTPIDGLPPVVPTNTGGSVNLLDVTPNGDTIVVARGRTAGNGMLDFYSLRGNSASHVRSTPMPPTPVGSLMWALAFDPVGDGVYVGTGVNGDVSYVSRDGRATSVLVGTEKKADAGALVVSPDGTRVAFDLERTRNGVWSVDDAF
jgi:hypothetical protein